MKLGIFRWPERELFLDKPSDFSRAKLTGADLSESRIMGATFRDAELAGADLRGLGPADFGGGLVLPVESEDGGAFTVDREGGRTRIRLAGAIVTFKLGLFLDGAYLVDANFSGSDLGDTSFQGAVLDCANFTGAKVDDASFDDVILFRDPLSDALLREALQRSPDLCKGEPECILARRGSGWG